MGAWPRWQARLLPDDRRLHLQDGPIDLIIEAVGSPHAVAQAYNAACTRFAGILDELCAELPRLRSPVGATPRHFHSVVARLMERAVHCVADHTFITPMAAVAGSVAEEILKKMLAASGDDLQRASVNNGGDIALHLGAGENTSIGLVSRPDRPTLFATASIEASNGVGGVATSGAPGRSFSLGIADAVTILARSASLADAAATIIANEVDLPGDPRIERHPARTIQPDSDLGDMAVTRSVAALDAGSIDLALSRGLLVAERLLREGTIIAAALHLQGATRLCGDAVRAASVESWHSWERGAHA